uniref:hypothetical protein n=1 Tax=Acetobacter malorum TaxID=178901 RepID=UPI00248D9FE2
TKARTTVETSPAKTASRSATASKTGTAPTPATGASVEASAWSPGATSMEAAATTKTTMHSATAAKAATSPAGMCQSNGRQRAGKKQARGQPSVMK